MKRAFRIKAEDEEVKINISVNFVFTPWNKEGNSMTDEQKDKLIVEALGECWHEYDGTSVWCKHCGSLIYGPHDRPNLATPEGFFWIWERAQKKEWWPIFKAWFWGHDGVRHLPMMIPEEFIDPIRGRDALAEWLRNNEDKWKS